MNRLHVPMFGLVSAFALAACASPAVAPSTPQQPVAQTPAVQTPAASNDTPAATCDADRARARTLGQVASPELLDTARDVSGTETVRVIKPGQAITKEYRADRLNLHVDEKNVVTQVSCG